MGNLSPELTGPVGLELARAVEQLPEPHGMPAESRYEFEVWDGLRVGVVCSKATLEAQLSVDCVLDGELVVWTGERLDFDALQQRMVNIPATVRRRLAPAKPASFVAFDVIAVGSVDGGPPAASAWNRSPSGGLLHCNCLRSPAIPTRPASG